MFSQWKPVDWIVGVLTLSFSIILVIAMARTDYSAENLPLQIKLYQAMFLAILGIISVYVAARVRSNKRNVK